jgi:hypothetical protein
VLHTRRELMQRIKDPLTIDVLEKLQWYFETRDLRKRYTIGGCELEGIREIEKQSLAELIETTQEWLRPTNAHKTLKNRSTVSKPEL